MLDENWSRKLDNLLQQWETLYRQGSDFSAQRLAPDGTGEFLDLLQERTDQRRKDIEWEQEESLQAALDGWQEQYDDGIDRSARQLCPDWSEQRVKVLDERIAARRAVQERVQAMFDDKEVNEAEGSKMG